MEKNKELVHIVFASDDRYAQHVAVAMASILLHTETPERICFFVLDDGISSEKQEKISSTAEHLHGEVHFIPVEGEAFSSFFVSAQLSRAAYFRLAIADLLPRDIERVIYLDCDLLVLDDIVKLWEVPLSDAPIAAVPDCGIMASSRSRREKKKCIGLAEDAEYFNSGVLLLDIEAWRKDGYGEQLAALVRENPYPHHDQDALNRLFMGRWHRLHLCWNVIPPVWFMFLKVLLSKWRNEAAAARQHPSILHYAGGYKPWEYEIYRGFNDAYYRILQETSFSDAVMPQFDTRKQHRSITRQMIRLRLGKLWGSLFENQGSHV